MVPGQWILRAPAVSLSHPSRQLPPPLHPQAPSGRTGAAGSRAPLARPAGSLRDGGNSATLHQQGIRSTPTQVPQHSARTAGNLNHGATSTSHRWPGRRAPAPHWPMIQDSLVQWPWSRTSPSPIRTTQQELRNELRLLASPEGVSSRRCRY
eukprot:758143-Hanusia_phi.AAC.1